MKVRFYNYSGAVNPVQNIWISLLIVVVAMTAIPCAAQERETSDRFGVITGQKQLFLDDHAVELIQGLKRVMHQPEKKGAVLRPDREADGVRAQARSAPVWVPEEGIYKLFYMAFPWKNGHSVRDQIGNAVAVSKDGLNWQRPKLNLVDINGSTENNRILLPDTGLRWTANALYDVIYDPYEAKPDRRYKGLLGANGRSPVVSPDGIRWSKLNVPEIGSSDVSRLIYDEQGKRYIAVVKVGGKYGRSAAVTFSYNFENWAEPVMTFHMDDKDQELAKVSIRKRLADPGMQNPMFSDPDPETGWEPPGYNAGIKKSDIPTWRAETYGLAVFPYEGLYIGLPQVYYPTGPAIPDRRNTVGFNEIQLIFTRDPLLRLENWVRVGERKPFLETSRLDNGLAGNFDRQQLEPPNRPLVMGDELWFYYGGLKGRAIPYQLWGDGTVRNQQNLSPAEKADYDEGWGAVCLAVLRLDGFVSLDAGEEAGEIVTKAFKANGNDLLLNADVGEGGWVKVEVIGEDGKALSGFGPDDCVALTGSEVRQKVAWQTGSYWELLNGRGVKLKIKLKNAKLYAFWTEAGTSDG